MKKVIVFRVEGVLVRDYDVVKMFDLKKRRLVKELIKKEGLELEGLKKGFEEDGNVERKMKMRDVLRRMEELENESEGMMLEMRKKFMEGGFERRKISVIGDLEDLERVKGLVGDMRMVFVSKYGRRRVMKLLKDNGLKEFEIMGSLDGLEGVEKEKVIMFGNEEDVEKMEGMGMKCVLGVEDMWKEIGIKRVG